MVLFENVMKYKRDRDSWSSHVTHRGCSTSICGMVEGFALGPDTSGLPLLGPAFLSANGDNHPYSTAGMEAVPPLASIWASQKPTGDLRQTFQGTAQPPSARISPGTHILPFDQAALSAFPRPRLSQLCTWVDARPLWNKCPGPPPVTPSVESNL